MSAYAKRNSGITVPLELDSDPEFNPGAWVDPDKDKSKKRRKSASGKSSRKKRKVEQQEQSDADFEETCLKGKGKKRSRRAGPSPLLEYFGSNLAGENLALSSSSDEENDGDDESMSSEGEEADGPPVVLKTWAVMKSASTTPINQGSLVPKNNIPAARTKPPDESVTESDGDMPGVCAHTGDTTEDTDDEFVAKVEASRAAAAAVHEKAVAEEQSLTEESDSEDTPMTAPSHSNNKTRTPTNDADSARPGFPLQPGQSHMGSLVLDPVQKIQVPGAINTYLREYQRDGVKFFWRQYSAGCGGLLGDDMGLGKTIQVIAFLSAIMHKTGLASDERRRREHVASLQDEEDWIERKKLPPANSTWPTCLIIAPSAVTENWMREFQTWGYFEVGMYTGKDRADVLKEFKMGRLDAMVTSFDLVRRDIDLLEHLSLSCVFVDEVHRVKNEDSQLNIALHKFQCLQRFGLTGTTVQNDYSEMHSILDWTNPDKLGSLKEWKKLVVKPLTVGQSAGASEEHRVRMHEVALTLKDKFLPKFFLRRTKKVIEDQLPKKIDSVVFCPLTDMQRSAYKKILSLDAVQNLVHKDAPCPCDSGSSRKKCCHKFDAGDLLRFMTVLIKVSNHLGLLMPSDHDTGDQLERNRELASTLFGVGRAPSSELAMLNTEFCGKWKALKKLLASWYKKPEDKNKVLIFTKSVQLLRMVQHQLNLLSYKHVVLEGKTKAIDRMPIIDTFQDDPDTFVFLISTLTGGTGLNLTSANRVVIFDPNWNPAHDLQAMDRAFRFGQKRDVYVYRLLGAGCLEELIYARQIYKQQQMEIAYNASVQTRYFTGVQGDKTQQGELFGIKNIFALHEQGQMTTKMAIEEANIKQMDWALANMESGRKKNTKGGKKMNEFDNVTAGGDEAELKGLSALLLDDDDDGPITSSAQDQEAQEIFDSIGIPYTHHNPELLKQNEVEVARTRKLFEQKKKKTLQKPGLGKKGNNETSQSTAVWPPVGRHNKGKRKAVVQHQQENGSEKQDEVVRGLNAARRKALIELGYAKSPTPAAIAAFAAEFFKNSQEDQTRILNELDNVIEIQSQSQ